MTILDTNVLSEMMRPIPDRRVVAWLDRQPAISMWTTSISVMEVRYGLKIIAPGKRRDSMTQEFERLLEKMGNRVVSFDLAAAEHTSDLMALRRPKGRLGDARDAMIAGIVLAQHASFATRNTDHFADLAVPVVNPWKD